MRRKRAWLPLPKDSEAFGFFGDGAEIHARLLATSVQDVVVDAISYAEQINLSLQQGLVSDLDARVETQLYMINLWRALAQILIKSHAVDVEPVISRTAISEPLRQLYLKLSRNTVYEPLLRKLFLNLSTKVDAFFGYV